MKVNNLKVNFIFYFLFILLLALSTLPASILFVNAESSGPILSVVLSGTTSVIAIPAMSIGSTFSVDVRVNNTGDSSVNINSIDFSLTWNPSTLSCVSANDGAYLPDQSNINDVPPDNNVGNVSFGLIVHNINNPSQCAPANSSGIVATVTFLILDSGQSNLELAPKASNIAYLTYLDNNGVSHDITNTRTINAVYGPMLTSINVYEFGTTNSTFGFPQGTDVLGSTFTVDVNISNINAEPIWAWNIGINWDPTVLQLETLAQGDYLTNTGGLYDGSQTVFIAGPIDNTAGPFPVDNIHGTIKQGISDIYLSNTTTTKPTGSLCLLTFEVVSYGNSDINVTAGDPTLIDNIGDSQPVILNRAIYVGLPPPAPSPPIAVIHNQVGSTTYLPGATITLDAFQSIPGFDVTPNPNIPNFPIISYFWSVFASPEFDIPTSGNSITFMAPQLATAFLVTLTVTTATNPGDPSYVNTNIATIEFDPANQQVTNAGAQIDLYIVNPATSNNTYPIKFPTSQGIYNNTSPTASYVDTFAPQEQMNLQTFLMYNGASVPNTLVTFIVTPEVNPSNILATFVSYTNGNGYAGASYRLPKYNNTAMPFSNYTVTAFVNIAQVRVSDCFTFQYNYILNIFSVTQPRETSRGHQTSCTATIQSNSFINQNYVLSWTVTDSYNVPIISGETMGIAYSNSGNSQQITLTIPTYSYYGTATLHVNLFNADPADPSQNALPYCPEADQHFIIDQ